MSERPIKPYAVSTAEEISRLLREPNPVTRAVLAQIIGDRIDRHEIRHMALQKSLASADNMGKRS